MSNLVVLPAADFLIKTDEQGNDWIVNKTSGAAYMSLTALANCAETYKSPLSALLNGERELPKALQGIDFSGLLKIERDKNPEPYTAIPADLCYDLICYYAFEARGSEERVKAKALAKAMGKAGSAVYVYGQAGYVVKAVDLNKPMSALDLFESQVRLFREQQEEINKIKQQQESQRNLLADLSKKVEQISEQSFELESAYQTAKQWLDEIDATGIEPLEFNARVQLNRIVRAYCVVNNIQHRYAWNLLYRNFRDKYHIDLKVRANNANCSTLDYAESHGHSELLLRVALQTFVVTH